MRHIYLCGHGEWNPENGFINMPKGTTINFYMHHAKTMLQDAVLKIVAGTYTSVHQAIDEFKLAPNMTLCPDDADNLAPTRDALVGNPEPDKEIWFVNQETTLKQLFANRKNDIAMMCTNDGGVTFHWTCCRYVSHPRLKVKGESGFNASEDLVDKVYVFRDRTDDDRRIKEVPFKKA